MTKLISAVAAALAIAAAGSAHAQTQKLVMVSTTLEYQAQDVASSAGATKMLRRIQLAAQKLCAPNSPAARQAGPQVLACRHAAVERAVVMLDAPLVTAAYQVGGRQVASR